MPQAAGAPSSCPARRGALGAGLGYPNPAAGPRGAAGFRGRGGSEAGGGGVGGGGEGRGEGGQPTSPSPPARGGLSAIAGPRAWTPPGRPPAHPRPGSAAFPAAGSASSLGHGSRPPVQLSKQGVSLSFWLTKSQRGTGGLNACVWTQAIIPNYSFSFEPARPAGELAAERAP